MEGLRCPAAPGSVHPHFAGRQEGRPGALVLTAGEVVSCWIQGTRSNAGKKTPMLFATPPVSVQPQRQQSLPRAGTLRTAPQPGQGGLPALSAVTFWGRS